MKRFLVAVSLVLAAPSVAHAAPAIVAQDVPLHGQRVLAGATPEFDLVGVHWRGPGSVSFRTRSLSGRWSGWHPAAPEPEDGPDRAAQTGWRIGSPYWTGAADAIRYRIHGRVTRLRAYFVWSPVDALPPRRLSAAGSPPIITRSAWGADETIRRAPPQYADAVRFAVVHHTAGTNSYSASQSAAIVRGIEIYHVKANGWNDIGYNFLVDKYGQVFEGRYGGIDKNVVGAHAEGFNYGSVGVAVLGTYDDSAPPAAAQEALANLLAWRLDVAHVDPLSTVTVASGGNARYAAGTPVFLRAVSGHRDTGFTSCPGNALYARLAAIAARVAAIGLPKLYAPAAQGQPGGPVTFRATLSTPLAWTVTVTDSNGKTVASGSGVGTAVSWTWDASKAPPGRYGWTIAAGPDVRPATGFVGAAPVPLALKNATASPRTISPNGDGVADRATIAYTLSTAANVTAVLQATDGKQVATLFSDERTAGKHTFTFTADGVADGRYEIVLSATDGKTAVSATVPVTIDRTVASFTVAPAAFSPNGDGRKDSIAFSFDLARAAHVRTDVVRGATLVAPVAVADLPVGAQSVAWDGVAPQGRIPDGRYAARLTVTSAIGTTQRALPFRIDTVPPTLRAVSVRRLVFRVSERSTVHVVADGHVRVRTGGPGIVRFFVRGRVRHVRAFATDLAGNVSRTLHR